LLLFQYALSLRHYTASLYLQRGGCVVYWQNDVTFTNVYQWFSTGVLQKPRFSEHQPGVHQWPV